MKNKILIFNVIFIISLFVSSNTLGADSSSVNISAVVLSKNVCRFNSNNVNLNFGTISADVSSDVVATAVLTFRCGGSTPLATFSITDDDGLYETGPGQKRMQNQLVPSEFLPYTMTYTPQMGTIPRNTNTPLTITGTISINDLANATAGNYTDTVILSIVP